MSAFAGLRGLLFPPESRSFAGQRWVNVALRTLHLVGVAGLGAGFLYSVPGDDWRPYHQLALASGGALAVLYIWSNGLWLIQLRGLLILLKLILLASMSLFPDHRGHLLLAVLVISGYIAHASGNVRYYSPFHGRRLEHL